MSQDFVTQIIYQAVNVCLLVSMPAIGIGLLVGFMISLFQAVTQIQEQTLTFVPKVIAVLLMIVFTSPWMISMMIDFTVTLWSAIPNMVQ
ncbi:MAG: flagellar biosynthesis protein FliQ [Candidatus Margulisiibacteriota bacterium]|jgi:flagellar biosynthetic protein FliQ